MKKLIILSIALLSIQSYASLVEKNLMLSFAQLEQREDLKITSDAAAGTYYVGDESITCKVNFAAGECDASSLKSLSLCKTDAVTCKSVTK